MRCPYFSDLDDTIRRCILDESHACLHEFEKPPHYTVTYDEFMKLYDKHAVLYQAVLKLSKGNRSPGVLQIAREALAEMESK